MWVDDRLPWIDRGFIAGLLPDVEAITMQVRK
jgi:hypothetical protein